MFKVGDIAYVIGDFCDGHYFDPDNFPLKVEVLQIDKGSREGDPTDSDTIRNYQEYRVKALEGGEDKGMDQWVAFEDLMTEEEYNNG